MKTLIVTAPGACELIEVPVPQPGPGQVLLRVAAVATCPQWDLHLRHNEPMFVGHQFVYPYTPGQPGHEATGTIAALGDGVTDFAVGDRVSAWRDQGQHRPGCYAEFAVLDAANTIRVPARLPLAATASVELAMCVGSSFLMLRGMGALAGRRFGVMGLGPAGLVALQMARAEGAREVVGFDFNPARRELARALGADEAHDPREVGERCAGRGALDSSIDCVGAKASVEWLMDRTADVLALFGVQREDYTFAVRHYGGLRLCGYQGHHRAAAEYAVELLEAGRLDLSALVTKTLALAEYNAGVELLERQAAVKVLFVP